MIRHSLATLLIPLLVVACAPREEPEEPEVMEETEGAFDEMGEEAEEMGEELEQGMDEMGEELEEPMAEDSLDEMPPIGY